MARNVATGRGERNFFFVGNMSPIRGPENTRKKFAVKTIFATPNRVKKVLLLDLMAGPLRGGGGGKGLGH